MGDVIVKLRGDIRDLQSNLAKASASIKSFASTAIAPIRALENSLKSAFSMKNLIIGGSATLAVKKIVGIGAAAEEAENLFDVSFGKMADSVRSWSKQLGDSLKVSDTGLRQTAGSFKLFLDGFDFAPEKAAAMSKALTTMAYDMSSLRNLRFEDSLTKLTAALAGEVEPMRRIGVTVNDNTVKLWAQKEGLDANVQAWTEQQKIVARFAVISQGLEKDQGDLQRTMGSTTNLLRSISDQIRELAIRVYDEWKPAIQATLTSVRDWLIKNRDTIAEWAGKIGAYFTYVKEVFSGFVETLQKSPKEGFQVLMQSLIEVMRAAAQIAVDLAIRIGKGIWEGVREGVLGGIDEGEVKQRAMELYKAGGGKTYVEQGSLMGVGFGGGKAYTNPVERPYDTDAYGKAQTQAWTEAQQRQTTQITTPILAGFGENWQDAFSHIGEGVRQTSETMTTALDQAKAKLSQSLAEIDAKFSKGEAESAMRAWGQAMTDTGRAATGLSAHLKALHQEAGQTGVSAIDAFTAKLRDEIATMQGLNDVMLKGHSAYEREIILQRLIHDAREQGIQDVSQYTGVLRGYAEQLNKIQEQQNSPGGLLGGLRDLKGELPTIKEKLYDIGKAAREGIAGALADAVFEAKNLKEAMNEVLKSIARMAFEYQMNRSVAGIMGAMPWNAAPAVPVGQPGTSGTFGLYSARGGIVPNITGGIVYAASGAFIPRGTDTVPAMLTPGEAVIDRGTTAGLRRVFGGSGNATSEAPTVNIINQTSTPVDSRGVDTKFDGKRWLVGVLIKDKHNGGPISRSAGRPGFRG